jgi:dihydrofolate reductase
MMKLRVFESISIDGYFTDADNSVRWAHRGRDAEFDAWVAGNASGGGVLLFGRKTYEEMVAFWPTEMAAQQMPVVAKGMNAATKYVVSKTLEPTWQNTTAIRDLVSGVRALKASEGPGIAVLGSGSIAAQLGDAGLVDEWQFVIVPVALGGGRTVFHGKHELKLVEQRAFASGNVVVTYAAT